MKIALDYDGTVTEDPELWAAFAIKAKSKGHDVRIVTFRNFEDKTNDMVWFAEAAGDIYIIFTGRVPKKAYCASINWEPDVWIDDHPDLILHDSDWTPEEHAAWRESIKEDLATV